MQHRKTVSVLVAALMAGSMLLSSVDAQAKTERTRATKARTVSFEDDVVETSYLRPESTVVETLNKKKRSSLIRIRMDFFAKIIRSARDL